MAGKDLRDTESKEVKTKVRLFTTTQSVGVRFRVLCTIVRFESSPPGPPVSSVSLGASRQCSSPPCPRRHDRDQDGSSAPPECGPGAKRVRSVETRGRAPGTCVDDS